MLHVLELIHFRFVDIFVSISATSHPLPSQSLFITIPVSLLCIDSLHSLFPLVIIINRFFLVESPLCIPLTQAHQSFFNCFLSYCNHVICLFVSNLFEVIFVTSISVENSIYIFKYIDLLLQIQVGTYATSFSYASISIFTAIKFELI